MRLGVERDLFAARIRDLYPRAEVVISPQIPGESYVCGVEFDDEDYDRVEEIIGVPIQETATLYGKLQQAVRMLGSEQKDALSLTESISQALRISGASATEEDASKVPRHFLAPHQQGVRGELQPQQGRLQGEE